MLPILITSVMPFVGKNVVALGVADRLRRDGKSVGYFKPIGPLPMHEAGIVTDEDAVFFRRVLGLSDPLDAICPIVLTDQTVAAVLRGGVKDARERILSAFKTISRNKDLVVAVSMGRLSCGLALGYSMDQLARDIGCKVLVVARYHWPMETLDGILQMRNLLPEHFVGVVFNRIAASRMQDVEQAVRPFLKSHGIEVFGVAPEDTVLNAVPIAELVEALDGRVLCCGDKLDGLIEHFSIGAMNVEAALRFFQRVPNKAVITGGDRADLQLAALQTSTRCLVLTGDLYPNERILARAEDLGVPVILVGRDTSSTAETCERLRGHLTLHSEKKIGRVREVMDPAINWELLYKSLGLK